MRLCRLARPPCGCASGINGFGFEFAVQASRQWKSCNLDVTSMASHMKRPSAKQTSSIMKRPSVQQKPAWNLDRATSECIREAVDGSD